MSLDLSAVKFSRRTAVVRAVQGLVLAAASHSGWSGVTSAAQDGPSVGAMRDRAVAFLKLTQAADGSWTSPTIPGITGLATFALLESGVSPDEPHVAKALQFLLSHTREDGGIYLPTSSHKNYETSISLLALASASRDGRYKEQIARAEKFLRGLQWDETEGLKPEDAAYGGAGYGKSQRPDLSNTTFLVEALKASGAKADDPALQKALKFVSRCQNLEGEHNNTPFPAKVNDGGFYYTPAAGGNSQAGQTENGGLRSYASMTYAGLKSMIYAGLTADDPRVKAATAWLRKHYSLDENPGLGQQGLFYYYHTVAKTMTVAGVDQFEDAAGHKHDWRAELLATLQKQQKPNGSWVNAADRWYEGDPHLVTSYALLALALLEPAKPTR